MAIQKNRVASMRKYKNDAVTVRHVALAKHYAAENYKTTFLTKSGRRVEHLLCAQVTKDAWLVHDGNVLTPKGLFRHE